MLERQRMEDLERKLIIRRAELLDRLDIKEESWLALREREIEYEEESTREALVGTLDKLEEGSVSELNSIERALQKMRLGQYGICEQCGRDIHPGRLEAVPHTDKCLQCAS